MPDFFKDLGLSSPVTSLDEDTTSSAGPSGAQAHGDGSPAAPRHDGAHGHQSARGDRRATSRRAAHSRSTPRTASPGTTTGQASTTARDLRTARARSGTTPTPPTTTPARRTSTLRPTQSEDSAASVDLHAKLVGKVQVNFKSETFPLEKMADVPPGQRDPAEAPAGMQAT